MHTHADDIVSQTSSGRNADPAFPVTAISIYGCKIVWQRGCMDTRKHGNTDALIHGLHGLHGYTDARILGCMDICMMYDVRCMYDVGCKADPASPVMAIYI